MADLAYNYKQNVTYEQINGTVYMMSRPSMTHAQIQSNIHGIFKSYLKGKSCRTFCDGDVFLGEKTNVVPDVMIVCDPEIIKKDGVHGAPDLVVEILSPSTARKDRADKFFTYEKYGVKEYWIVSPEAKSVEVYINKDGKFMTDNVYTIYPDYLWNKLEKEEKAEAIFEIKVSLYDDFIVKLEDIFEYVE